MLYTLHPIALDDQKYIIPDNAEVGDNVGKVNYLWSHPYFHNEKWGISVGSSDYTFEIVGGNGDGTFAINASTGELTIADNSSLSADKSITVRVKLYDWYYKDTTCTVLVIPEADCIFFDSSYLGGDSDGTRAKPFLKLNNYGTSTGTAGKTYFYKRGETYSSDRNEFENPKVGGEYPGYINMGAWGQGARPVIDMTGSSSHFVSVGTIPWGNDPIVASDICNNFRMFDFEITNDTAADCGHILIKPAGDNIEFHRIKCHNTSYEDGFIYLPTSDPIAGNEAERNIYFADIELSECQNRGFKIESEAVTVRNCYGENNGSLTDTEIPAPQAAHRPDVDIKYVVCVCDAVHTDNLGLQVRAGKQTYQWCYIEGISNVNVVYVVTANDGVGGDYDITSTSGFSDMIIKDCKQASYFGRQGDTTDNPDGVKFERIKLIECDGGFQVAYGAKNTLLSYIDSSSSDGWGFQVFSHAGTGTKIQNCTAMNTFSGSGGLNLGATAAVVVTNTNYSGITGTMGAGSSNNSTSSDIHVLNGAGTNLGYSYDIYGNQVPVTPSIGAVESSAIVEKPVGWPSLYDSGKGVQGGAGGELVECNSWSQLLIAIQADDDNADNNPKTYVYTGNDISLISPNRHVFTDLHNKTILGFFGQTILEAELRFVDCSNIIIRNIARRGPYYPWGTGSGEAELDYLTFNGCNGVWVDYCDFDGEFQYSGAGDQYPDGCIDTNKSDYISVTRSKFWNTQRGMLIGYSDGDPDNLGKLNTTIAYCWFKNNGGRQPKARDGKIHMLNNYGTNDPVWDVSWSPENKPSGQHFGGIDTKSQFYSQNNYWENGQSLYRDDDGSGSPESGLIIDGDYINPTGFDYTGGTVSKRPENVLWAPDTETGYEYPLPLMTPSEAKDYVEAHAGANWHLQDVVYPVVSVTVEGSGSVTGAGSIPSGEDATLTATAGSGYEFSHWEEDEVSVSTDNPYVFEVTEDISLVAVFEEIPTYSVTLSANPVEGGTVEEITTGPYEEYEDFEINAIPADGYEFVYWSIYGSGFYWEPYYEGTMGAEDLPLVANFELMPTYTVDLSVTPEGGGIATEVSTGPYNTGDTVELSATPADNYRFVGWKNGSSIVSTNPNYNFVMGYSSLTLVAVFEDMTPKGTVYIRKGKWEPTSIS